MACSSAAFCLKVVLYDQPAELRREGFEDWPLRSYSVVAPKDMEG
jgi:hypothetical protein